MSDATDCQSLFATAPVQEAKRGSGSWHFLSRVLRFPFRAANGARRHPFLTALFLLVLLAGSGAGLWGYAHYQWRAAQGALSAERPDEARERLALCLRVWPRNPEVHLLAARAARLTGDFPGAETHLNRCLELQEGATEGVQLEFLLMRVQAGDIDTLAPALFRLVDQKHPESPMILDSLARAYIHRLRYKPAYGCLSRWIEARPTSAKPHYWRAWTLERLNNPKAAKLDYARALELDPDLLPARLRVAEMHLEDRMPDDAQPHLEYLQRQAPDDPRVRARLGIYHYLRGNGTRARELMEPALTELPTDAPLLITLANLDIQENQPERAEPRLRAVLRADPADTEALFALAAALRLQGRTQDAADALAEHDRTRAALARINAILKDLTDSPTGTADNDAELGGMFLEIGRENVALYWLERALERDPNNARAHRALAEHYQRKGDRPKAEAHRQQARAPATIPTPGSGTRPAP
ncbi:tetratricopeptide repeat protein [Gemmata sp. SH-PL17]|uniref:tetratricopeptide repeat protein n=1 Tax=Gemmata sp. SH-PL17 TaxID=1630693 RepID=UPI00078D43DC|nr:tetratricopeptide repeat protein [Gemmata sp. SH-PL17]AMV23962.1 tetratricopeptide repeat protein [Gemmata sp. SH-PL17]